MINSSILHADIEAIWLADTQQSLFNSLMQAMSRPGKVEQWSKWQGTSTAYLALLATLLDAEVSLADVAGLLSDEQWPMLQAKKAEAETANFVLCDMQNMPDFEPTLGTLASPDYAATLICCVEKLCKQQGDIQLRLSGPGISENEVVFVTGCHPQWPQQRNLWCADFPLGVDCILVSEDQVMCLPRSTQVEVIDSDTTLQKGAGS